MGAEVGNVGVRGKGRSGRSGDRVGKMGNKRWEKGGRVGGEWGGRVRGMGAACLGEELFCQS